MLEISCLTESLTTAVQGQEIRRKKNQDTLEPIMSLCFGLMPYSLGITPSASCCHIQKYSEINID
jgi:hypothetical protein